MRLVSASEDAKKQGAVLGWGQFLTVALNFLIIASVLFLAIRERNYDDRTVRRCALDKSEVPKIVSLFLLCAIS